jgi:hypothetical protein
LRTPSRRWVWVFVALGVLALLAVVIPLVYNLRQQFRPEQLAEARQKWSAHRPPSYRLEYTVHREGDPDETVVVEVRQGVVARAVRNGREVPAGEQARYGMEALFEMTERYYEEDHGPGGRRTFARAVFDERDGHLVQYVRRVSGSHERMEVDVRLTPGPE